MSHNLFLPEHLMDVRHITKMSAPEQQQEFQLVPGSKVRTLKAQRTPASAEWRATQIPSTNVSLGGPGATVARRGNVTSSSGFSGNWVSSCERMSQVKMESFRVVPEYRVRTVKSVGMPSHIISSHYLSSPLPVRGGQVQRRPPVVPSFPTQE